MSNIHLYQIAYSQETLEQIEPGYKILDNLDNLRPDWFEYWPIRNFLLNNELNEDDLYGFFSPKFKYKTNLSYRQVYDFISKNIDIADIFLFSPQFDMGAFFINVFEQGEVFDPGFMETFELFINELNNNISPRNLIMDSNQIIFSNYFVARPKFIRKWLILTEKLYRICEDNDGNIGKKLCTQTSYPGKVERKVFILERLASYLLTIDPDFKVKAYNPISMAWSALPTNQYRSEAIICDALKKAYRQTEYYDFMKEFSNIRNRIFMKK